MIIVNSYFKVEYTKDGRAYVTIKGNLIFLVFSSCLICVMVYLFFRLS